MSDLKKQLIRLGSTNPELRPHIRPLLDKVASRENYSLIQVTKTNANGTINGTWVQHAVAVTKEEALRRADATMKANGNRIDVAVVPEVSGAQIGSFHMNLKRISNTKLGSTDPEIRKILASEEVVVGPKVRITLTRDAIYIEELPSPPLRTKTLRKASFHSRMVVYSYDMPWYMPSNLNRQAKFNSNMTFDSALSALKDAFNWAKAQTIRDGKVDANDPVWSGVEKHTRLNLENVPYLEVEPVDYKPITVRGKDFTLTSEWSQFRQVTNYSDPHDMEPSTTTIASKTKASARKLFKILKANPEILKNMYQKDWEAWLTANRIAWDMHFSVWR